MEAELDKNNFWNTNNLFANAEESNFLKNLEEECIKEFNSPEYIVKQNLKQAKNYISKNSIFGFESN